MATGKEIKRLRGKLSAEKAAALIGVDAERLRKWEARDADPFDTGDIKAVEDYFGCKMEDLSKLENFQFIPKGKLEVSNQETNEATIQSLSHSVELSAQARLEDATSRRIEAENTRRLIYLLEVRLGVNSGKQSSGNEASPKTGAAEYPDPVKKLKQSGRNGQFETASHTEPPGNSKA